MARILIVDDNPNNRLLIVSILSHDQHAVFEAADGTEGLRIAKQHRPHLIILDLHMPGMNGITFMKSLRTDPELSDTTVALYTDTSTDAMMRDFMNTYRIECIVPKPSEPERVLSIVRDVLGKSHV